MVEQGVTQAAVDEVERRVLLSVLTTHDPTPRAGGCGCGVKTEDWPGHVAAVIERAEFIMWREYGAARGWLTEGPVRRLVPPTEQEERG